MSSAHTWEHASATWHRSTNPALPVASIYYVATSVHKLPDSEPTLKVVPPHACEHASATLGIVMPTLHSLLHRRRRRAPETRGHHQPRRESCRVLYSRQMDRARAAREDGRVCALWAHVTGRQRRGSATCSPGLYLSYHVHVDTTHRPPTVAKSTLVSTSPHYMHARRKCAAVSNTHRKATELPLSARLVS